MLKDFFFFFYIQAWAVYKGKYTEGRDKADPTMWKTRLRCALNKSTDFQEVPDRNQLDITEPYKVYRIQLDNGQIGGTKIKMFSFLSLVSSGFISVFSFRRKEGKTFKKRKEEINTVS